MSRAAVMRSVVDKYVGYLESGTAADLASLFAEDAVLEDPAGSEPRNGRTSIREFYGLAEPYKMSTKLLAVRITADSAAAYFEVETIAPSGEVSHSSPIDVFTFDEDGKITNLRAYWGPDDFTAA